MRDTATARWQITKDRVTTGQATGEEHSNSRVGSKILDILEVLAGRHNYSKAT
jgi:hypothetical protein